MTATFNVAAAGRQSALLLRVGLTLYGEHWQERLARELDVSGRSVRYWLAGRRAIPPGVWGELRELAIARQAEIPGLLDELSLKVAELLDLPLEIPGLLDEIPLEIPGLLDEHDLD